MNGFDEWLKGKGYAAKTIGQRIKDTKLYLDWLKAQNIPAEQSTYPTLMDYVGSLRKASKSSTVIKHAVRAIELYYDYRKLENPARNIKIRKQPTPKNKLLTREGLQQIYEHFTPTNVGNNKGY
jgi:site-specific recombinase XerD